MLAACELGAAHAGNAGFLDRLVCAWEGTVGVKTSVVRAAVLAAFACSIAGCRHGETKAPDAITDEATKAGFDSASFHHAAEPYFHDMDGGVALTPTEEAGRNMWLVWTGGNDRFWDYMRIPTNGGFDLLKIVGGPPGSNNSRAKRWGWMGAINEPCFQAPAKPDRFGIWVDERKPGCAPDPFADEAKYPGVKTGARGTNLPKYGMLPVGSIYGQPTGIIGLRLFTNPDFDAKAAAAWDPAKYYSDPNYYNQKNLVRPYRVGMSCAFCHVGPSPSNPPSNPAEPEFANLSSTVGAQYLWADRLFIWNPDEKDFVTQWVKTFRPGALDTSLVSSDNINNPRTMNALYNVEARLRLGKVLGHEQIAGGERDNKQFNDYIPANSPFAWLRDFFSPPGNVGVPRVLKDGSDSVGALGALNRVYLNIGLFSEDWTTHFQPVTGGKPVSPILIANAVKNSAYWRMTEAGTPATALFFLKAARPDYLNLAPGGAAFADPPALVAQGRRVFSDTCARCHSSKGPTPPENARLADAHGPHYLDRFKLWWRWTQSDDFKTKMWNDVVSKPDFLNDNYLSTEVRIPVTLLRTNLCSPLATNAIANNIWDNFSSHSYKSLQSVGQASFVNPLTGAFAVKPMPAGGRGYTRPPSLISLWSTAPYLLNNTVGPYNQDPSVGGRIRMFNAGIEQMLWPERRPFDKELGPSSGGWIDRTSAQSSIVVPLGFVKDLSPQVRSALQQDLRGLVDPDGNIRIGRIPKGMAVNLLVNLQPLSESADTREIVQHYRLILRALRQLKVGLATMPANADDAAIRRQFGALGQTLLGLSKCPDFVVNRGHYFGTKQFNDPRGLTPDELYFLGRPGVAGQSEPELNDGQKRALIAFLKTL